MCVSPWHDCDSRRTLALGVGGGARFIECCGHTAKISVDSGKDLVFRQLGGSAVPMTRWLLFVKSHESKAATTQSACPSEMCCFFVRVFLTSRE